MSRSRSEALLVVGLAAVVLGGCEIEASRFRYGQELAGLTFKPYDDDEGIHPSQVVLLDPNNPFRVNGVSATTKWEILAGSGNVGTFFAWASLLANIPTGEHQFYTAQKLADMARTPGEVEEPDQPAVAAMAVRAYQSVLDNFPDSVTFDATGTTPFRLATPAYLALKDLGAPISGGWVLVNDPDGIPQAVRGGGGL